jgi:hypothetical protein
MALPQFAPGQIWLCRNQINRIAIGQPKGHDEWARFWLSSHPDDLDYSRAFAEGDSWGGILTARPSPCRTYYRYQSISVHPYDLVTLLYRPSWAP